MGGETSLQPIHKLVKHRGRQVRADGFQRAVATVGPQIVAYIAPSRLSRDGPILHGFFEKHVKGTLCISSLFLCQSLNEIIEHRPACAVVDDSKVTRICCQAFHFVQLFVLPIARHLELSQQLAESVRQLSVLLLARLASLLLSFLDIVSRCLKHNLALFFVQSLPSWIFGTTTRRVAQRGARAELLVRAEHLHKGIASSFARLLTLLFKLLDSLRLPFGEKLLALGERLDCCVASVSD
mmetsp:Transcript_39689/g.96356  ORF Transcript_39689/g.96356 Transcript_39689/m.96356 type:complete len:239 (-) Transcript_39689:286-1002(-)